VYCPYTCLTTTLEKLSDKLVRCLVFPLILHQQYRRFKHLRAVLLTDSAEVAQAGVLAGCHAVHQLGASSKSSDDGCAWQSQSPRQLASHIAKLLRVQPLLPPGTGAPARAETAPALAAVLAAGAAGAMQPENSVQGKQVELEEEEGEIEMLILALDAQHAQPPSASTPLKAAPADRPEAAGSAEGQEEAGKAGSTSSSSSNSWALEWLDSLVRHLGGVQGFRDTVLLSLVLGPGPGQPGQQLLLPVQQPVLAPRRPTRPTAAAAAEGDANRGARAVGGAGGGSGGGTVEAQRSVVAAASNGGVDDFPAVRRPIQSYQVAGLEQVAVDERRPALVVHRLPGVIRHVSCCWHARLSHCACLLELPLYLYLCILSHNRLLVCVSTKICWTDA
jgi:hypothetical protein